MPRSALFRLATAAAVALTLAGCSSPAKRAAAAAAESAQAYANGDMIQAKLKMLRAVGYRDDVVDYWLALAQISTQLRDFGGAYDAYTHIAELDPGNLEALRNLAELSLGGNRLKDADENADKVLAIDPQDIRGRLVKGYVAVRQNRFTDAERWADQILAAYPLEDAPLVLKARALFASGKQADAIGLVERAIPVRGASQPKLDTLLEFYRKTGDTDAVQRTYSRYVNLQPDNFAVKLAYATELYRTGKTAGAEATLLPLLQSSGQPERVADVMIAEGGDSPSPGVIEQAADGAPASVVASLARVALEKGHPELAMTLLQPFIAGEMSPAVAAASALYADAQREAGQPAAALALAQKVIDFDEANPRALKVRAEVSLLRHQLNQALSDARVLVRDHPTSPEDRVLLARIHAARGDLKLAEATLREAYNDMPGSEAIVADYAALLTRQKRPAAAVDILRGFTTANPRSIKGWTLLADLCRNAGDAACAKASVEASKRLEMARAAPPKPA